MALTAGKVYAFGRSSTGAGAVSLLTSILLLGATWPIMKIALRSSTPLWFTVGRLLVPAVLYALVLAWQGRLKLPPRTEWPITIVIAVFQSALMIGLITLGVSYVGAGRSAILTYTMPIWVIPGAMLLLHERVSRQQVFGLVLGVAGLVVLFNPFDFDWTNRPVIFGNACVLLGAMAWSFSILRVRGHEWRVDSIQIMPFQSLLATLLLIPVAGFCEGWVPVVRWSPAFLLSFAHVCVMGTFVAFWLVVEAGRRLPAIQVSLAQLATPVIGIVASAIWVDEAPTSENIVGLALIIAGVGVATWFTARPNIESLES